MKKIKVVIIVPSLVTGGAENMVCQLSKTLNREKFCLKFVCLSSKQNTPFERDLSNQGIEIHYLNNKGKLSLKTAIFLWRLLDKYKPDIVHTHLHASLYAFPWIYTHKVLLLHTIHNTPKFEFSSRITRLMKKLYQNRKAVPIAISNKIKVETSKFYNLPLDDIELVYNPVNVKKFKNKEINHSKHVKFVHVARLNPQKNQKLLLEAFANVKREFKETSLFIVGDGELRNDLEKQALNLNLTDSVIFTGNISNVEDYLSNSDIFVLSSAYEGLPLSILEAMAAGLPIISTKVGGIEDIIDNNGILVENGDLKALTNAMLQIAKNDSLRIQMSQTSFNLSKKYDISLITNEYEALYKKYSKVK